MKFNKLTSGLLALLCGGILSAQIATQPGQSATSRTFTSSSNMVPAIGQSSSSQTVIIDREERHNRFVTRIWVISLLSAAAASGLDAGTSWGKRESNGLLASSDGNFGMRGVSIKAAMLTAVVVPQILLSRHHALRAKFAIGNFAEAGIFSAVAIHNMGVNAPGH